ncbi:hypothetical protein MUU47_00410 [Scandinavium sp. H11S7]|uniref:Uncharacterized protein n=1 Tax=Scandinavium hiltneri TaxID=2926519 RepID=A0ABT2DVY4_9ENTR|nr:hypothetical protein [Scandinavium hiltneri]MCS2159626.1 hypothetical protein [Scandinavium hiltneri]
MDSKTLEKLRLVGAVEAHPAMMPGVLFVTCPDAAKSCVSVRTCQLLHAEIMSRQVNPESCARPCAKCATGGILWREQSTGLPPVSVDGCPRCGRLGARLVGKIDAEKKTPTPWTKNCISCWNRVSEHKKGSGARGRSILSPPLMNPWIIGRVDGDVPAWSVWIGDSLSEAILRQILYDPMTEFHNQRPGITGFDEGGHPVYFCEKHPQTALRWDWNSSSPAVGAVRFYCPECVPPARALPVAFVRPALSFATVQEAVELHATSTIETPVDTAIICAGCHRAPLRIARSRSGPVTATCPCCESSATSQGGSGRDWLDPEPVQPPRFSVFQLSYSDFPIGSGAAPLQLEPTQPTVLPRVPQLPFNRLRACILAVLNEWDYLDGVTMAMDPTRGDGAELLALLEQLRALKPS